MIKPIKQNEKKQTAKKKAAKLGVKPRPSAGKVGYQTTVSHCHAKILLSGKFDYIEVLFLLNTACGRCLELVELYLL